MSKKTKKQGFNKVKIYKEDGQDYKITANIRHDDNCGNGHNSFAITGDIYRNGRYDVGGCIHDEIAKHFPELKPFIKWHLCSTDGPMHYVANTLYHASDKDCWGLRKDEKRQVKIGATDKLLWRLVTTVAGKQKHASIEGVKEYINSSKQPQPVSPQLYYAPDNHIGEGSEPDLKAARSAAIWPEANLEDFTEENLIARLPELMEAFKEAVESLGLEY